MQYTLKSIYINDKKKDGTPFKNKKGEPYKMANIETTTGIKASMYLDQKFNEKEEAIVSGWKAGDTVNIFIVQAGEFTNFKIPTKTDLLEEAVRSLEANVADHEKQIGLLNARMDKCARIVDQFLPSREEISNL